MLKDVDSEIVNVHAFYSRYVRMKPNGWPREAEDLTCPGCGAEEINCLEDTGTDLGSRVQCWICKLEFIVTANCWKWRECND